MIKARTANNKKIDSLHFALMDLMGVLMRPQPDMMLLREAGVTIDRALAPLLVRVGLHEPIGIVDLAELVGRDHSTVSRQIAKLEEMSLVERQGDAADQRLKLVIMSDLGETMVEAIRKARRRTLGRVLSAVDGKRPGRTDPSREKAG